MSIERYFLMCRNCDFMLSLLGQADRQVECCPSCGDDDIAYAEKSDRDSYINRLQSELDYIKGLENDK